MRSAIVTFSLFCFLLLQTSCEKVIDLKLKTADKKYIIEGNITNLSGPYTVTLSQTDTFSTAYHFRGVSGAAVSISDNTGNSETLVETTPGVYQATHLSGIEGRTYSLSVTIGTNVFTASSTMPQQVYFDSLYIRELVNISKTVKAVVPVFTDPKGQGNSYRFNQYINGNLDRSNYYQDDDFTDGQINSFALLQPDPDSTLRPNDEVRVDMQCIDKANYKYWFSLDQSSSGNYSNIPANPVTNIVGGALGYFSAHTSQSRLLIVK